MKNFLISLILSGYCSLICLATPDWEVTTNEEYLGSNDEVYAVMRTVIDNQGNYYSSREVKTLSEYSKSDNTIINNELVSDIIYNIDAEHIDPNTPPKVTKEVKATNNKLLLSVITTDYRKPIVATPIPAWTKRLSWKNEGLYLDESLLILSKNDITDKNLPFDEMREKLVTESVAAVYKDDQCIYFSLKFGDQQNYQNKIVRVSPELSKKINDWSTKLSDYLFISEHKNKEVANAASIKLIEIAKEKEYYAMNLEIWSVQKEPNTKAFFVVHRPFDLPMDAAKIKLLSSLIEQETKSVPSKNFLQKWIPFSIPKQEIDDDELEEAEQDIEEVE